MILWLLTSSYYGYSSLAIMDMSLVIDDAIDYYLLSPVPHVKIAAAVTVSPRRARDRRKGATWWVVWWPSAMLCRRLAMRNLWPELTLMLRLLGTNLTTQVDVCRFQHGDVFLRVFGLRVASMYPLQRWCWELLTWNDQAAQLHHDDHWCWCPEQSSRVVRQVIILVGWLRRGNLPVLLDLIVWHGNTW